MHGPVSLKIKATQRTALAVLPGGLLVRFTLGPGAIFARSNVAGVAATLTREVE